MPKATTPGYQQLIDTVIRQLVAHIQGSQFSYKGKRYALASSTLLQAIEAKCRELMAEVELTESELSFLEHNDLAQELVGSLDLYVKDGELPAKQMPIRGLAGLFFNAMSYNPKMHVTSWLPIRQSEAKDSYQDGGFATVDILKPLRVKEVARLVHQAIASAMELSEAQALLVILFSDVKHTAAQQLRVEYGLQGVRSAPIALFKSYISSAQPAVTGDTETWQNTVLTIIQIIYSKYFNERRTAENTQGSDSRHRALAILQELGSNFVRVLGELIAGQHDVNFVMSCKREQVALSELLDVNSLQITRLDRDNINNRLISQASLAVVNGNDDNDKPHRRVKIVPSSVAVAYGNDDEDNPSPIAASPASIYDSNNFICGVIYELPYKTLITHVASLLEERLRACNFIYKGKCFMLTTREQRARIIEKCKELMLEVNLTEAELQLLNMGNVRLLELANLIVATIDLQQAKGDLPSKENVTTSGLSGLFFNAMTYRPNVRMALLKSTITTADYDPDSDAEPSTLDHLLPIRAKEVAHCVHAAMATVMNLDQANDLLVTLRMQYAHPATQQLRVEYGVHGLRSPVAFASSFVNSQHVATGDTQTWQATVLAVAELTRMKYVIARGAAHAESDKAQLLELATSCDALMERLGQNAPPHQDNAFVKQWLLKRVQLLTLFSDVDRSPTITHA